MGIDIDVLTGLVDKYGFFTVLVGFILWENRRREKRYQEQIDKTMEDSKEREDKYIDREEKYISREQKYIEREEKYIQVIQDLSSSYNQIKADVSYIKGKLNMDDTEQGREEIQ